MTRNERVKKMVRSRNSRSGIRIINTRRKKAKRAIGKRDTLLLITLLVFLGCFGMVFAWSSFQNTQIGYEVSELKKEAMRLGDINRKLRVELAMLKSPQHLENLATEKLGLRPPGPDQVVVLP